jgi:hypothetical protein
MVPRLPLFFTQVVSCNRFRDPSAKAGVTFHRILDGARQYKIKLQRYPAEQFECILETVERSSTAAIC